MKELSRSVTWEDSADVRLPYRATVDGACWQVQHNEFPEEPFPYSLLVDSEIIGGFIDWPEGWNKPPGKSEVTPPPPKNDDDPHERGQYDYEMAMLKHQQGIKPSKLVEGVEPVPGGRLLAAAEARDARVLTSAERKAAAAGKEPFLMGRIDEVMGAQPGELPPTPSKN